MMRLPTRLRVSMGRAVRSAGATSNQTRGIPLLAVVAVVLLLAARAHETDAAATVLITLAFFCVMFIVLMLVTLRWSRPRTVSVVSRRGALVFSPPAVPLIGLSVVTGLAMLSIARFWSVPEQWSGLPFYARSMFVAGPLLGLFLVAETVWALRRPAGLRLDERGLSGVRAGPQVDLVWAGIANASVAEGKKRRLLVLAFASGRGVATIPEGAVSGDVYAVATVINYYLHHPDERGRLRDGTDAVRHVDAEVSAGRFDGT